MTTIEELKQQLEKLRKESSDRKEIVKLDNEIKELKEEERNAKLSKGFFGKTLKGLEKVGSGFMKVGENISKADISGSIYKGDRKV